MSISQIIKKITEEIINPAIYLLFSAATAFFVYGIVLYIKGTGGESAAKGKNIMLGGIIGLFIMASALGIVKILCNFFNNSC